MKSGTESYLGDVDTNVDLDNLQQGNNIREKEENCTHAINDPKRVTISIVDKEITNGKFVKNDLKMTPSQSNLIICPKFSKYVIS